MRNKLAVVALICASLSGGCDRKHTFSEFKFSPTLTLEDLESNTGKPTRTGASRLWAAYQLAEGGELRLFFANGERSGVRTLSSAELYSADGRTMRQVYPPPNSESEKK